MKLNKILNQMLWLIVAVSLLASGIWAYRWIEQNRILKQVIDRMSADSRVAEVLVTKSEFNETTKKILTTIKFLEYDTAGNALEPRYFKFHGNIMQFQSLVIRFEDRFIQTGDRLRGRSVYLFMKAFVLDGKNTQEFLITESEQIPRGYKISGTQSDFEKELWETFWDYALSPDDRKMKGIKNAQIEAPGSMFVPGTIYTLRIEHDGGLRIDGRPVPEILKGEEL